MLKKSLLKQPSAWVPAALSLTVLLAMLVRIILFGPPVREADEGVAAHLFQIWLVLEVLMIPFFVVKWLPYNPKHALPILALQVAACLAAMAPVFFLKL